MPAEGHLRACDADRERVVERLRAAVAEGRLSPEELDERLPAAFTARTYADLDAVLADLPRPGSTRRESAPREHGRRSGSPHDGRRRTARPTVGAWALAAVRANPLLLVVLIPALAAAGAMLFAAAITWMTLVAAVMILGGGHRHRIHPRRGPWSLMWGAGDRW